MILWGSYIKNNFVFFYHLSVWTLTRGHKFRAWKYLSFFLLLQFFLEKFVFCFVLLLKHHTHITRMKIVFHKQIKKTMCKQFKGLLWFCFQREGLEGELSKDDNQICSDKINIFLWKWLRGGWRRKDGGHATVVQPPDIHYSHVLLSCGFRLCPVF